MVGRWERRGSMDYSSLVALINQTMSPRSWMSWQYHRKSNTECCVHMFVPDKLWRICSIAASDARSLSLCSALVVNRSPHSTPAYEDDDEDDNSFECIADPTLGNGPHSPSVRPSGTYNLCPSPLNLRAAWRIVESVGYGPSRPTRQHGTNRVMSLFIGTTLLLFGYMSVLCVR